MNNRKKNNRKPTMLEVADLSGVSTATVSRVMSNTGYPVSAEKRDAVLAAATHLNYVPNGTAKKPEDAASKDLGVIVPTITNPFYTFAILGIEQELQKRGYNLLLCNSFRDRNRERGYLETLLSKQVNGVIISSVTGAGDNVVEYSKKGLEFVLLDQKIEGFLCNYLLFDSREGAKSATRYLVSHGHKRIAMLTTPLTRWTRIEIFEGYKEGLQAEGIEFDPRLLLEAGEEHEPFDAVYDSNVGCSLAKEFLQGKCGATAVLCVNDMVAMGFMQELGACGVRVPEDVSVMGFDDIPYAAMFSPPLTTVQCPAVSIGRIAARMLVEKIENKDENEYSIHFEPKIIERCTVKSI